MYVLCTNGVTCCVKKPNKASITIAQALLSPSTLHRSVNDSTSFNNNIRIKSTCHEYCQDTLAVVRKMIRRDVFIKKSDFSN